MQTLSDPMDPVILATITSALTLIATEAAKGAANEAGIALWARIKSMMGWVQEPRLPDVAPEIARKLLTDSELATKILELLQSHPEGSRQASTLVQSIDAEKVIRAEKFEVKGDFHM